MKNIKVLSTLIFVSVVLAGCSTVNKVTDQVKQTAEKVNPVTSIKDALSKSLTLECVFKDEQGKQTKVLIKNGAVRSDFTATEVEKSGSVLMKDKKIYFWNAEKKEGFVMAIPEVSLTPMPTNTQETVKEKSQIPQGGFGMNPQDFLSGIEKFKDSCKPAVVGDESFAVPSDVKFSDLSKLMTPPSGVLPTGGLDKANLNEENVNDLIKKFAPKE